MSKSTTFSLSIFQDFPPCHLMSTLCRQLAPEFSTPSSLEL